MCTYLFLNDVCNYIGFLLNNPRKHWDRIIDRSGQISSVFDK